MKCVYCICICVICLVPAFGQQRADTLTLKFPDKVRLPQSFDQAVKHQKSEFNRLFFRDSATTKNYSVQFMLDKIDHDSNYEYIFLAEYWLAFHFREMIPELMKRITKKAEVGLINTGDLIIWERVKTGQLKFYGHGGIADDDLFTVAGRANRLLKLITGEDFGYVSMKSSQQYLNDLQGRWVKWFRML